MIAVLFDFDRMKVRFLGSGDNKECKSLASSYAEDLYSLHYIPWKSKGDGWHYKYTKSFVFQIICGTFPFGIVGNNVLIKLYSNE